MGLLVPTLVLQSGTTLQDAYVAVGDSVVTVCTYREIDNTASKLFNIYTKHGVWVSQAARAAGTVPVSTIDTVVRTNTVADVYGAVYASLQETYAGSTNA